MRDQESLVATITSILIGKAIRGETATYQELALMTGLPSSGNALGATLSPLLYAIGGWCLQRGMPPLTVLVVRKSGSEIGLPGPGFWAMLGFNVENLSRREKRMWVDRYMSDIKEWFTIPLR